MISFWIVSVLLLGIKCLFAFEYTLICPSSTEEPTLQEIISGVLPSDITEKLDSNVLKDSPFFQNDGVKELFSHRLSIKSWVSDGQYTIDFTDQLFSFNDVFILQKGYSDFNLYCSNVPQGFGYLDHLCFCQTDDLDLSLLTSKDSNKKSWCLRKAPCTSKHLSQGLCSFNTDPLRQSCILIKNINVTENLQDHIKYQLYTPTVKSFIPNRYTKQYENKPIFRELINILDSIPYYLFNFFLGGFILIFVQDISENLFCQAFIEAIIGVFFALLIIVFYSSQMANSFTGRNNSSFLRRILDIPFTMSFFYFLFKNSDILFYILDFLLEIWDNGILGFQWAGKGYFIGCTLFSWTICWYFGIFEPESRFFSAMVTLVWAIGLVVFFHGTSSRDMSIVLFLLGTSFNYLRDWYNYYSLVAKASLENRKFTTKKMSKNELDILVKDNTKKALEALKEHLQSNPDELDKYKDRLDEDGKFKIVDRLDRFTKGKYGGTPNTESPLNTQSKYYILYYIFGFVVLLIAILVVYFHLLKN